MSKLNDDLIRHNMMVQRLAVTQSELINDLINSSLKDADRFIDVDQIDNLRDKLRRSIKPLDSVALSALADIAAYESGFTEKVLNKRLNATMLAVSRSALMSELLKNNMQINNNSRSGTQRSVEVAYRQFGQRKADEMAQIIKDGYYQKLSKKEIKSNLRRFAAGLVRRQALILSVTSVNFVINVARNAVYKKNNLIEYVEWVLDDDVQQHTDYCLEHEGRIYKVGEGPVPPAHWGCKSQLVPYFGKVE